MSSLVLEVPADCPALRIESIEVRRSVTAREPYRERWFVIVTAAGGEQGICLANDRLPDVVSLFARRVAPFFVDRDARDIERLLDEVYTWRSNYKYDSMPFWCSVAHVELAVLDLLGRATGRNITDLLGGRTRDRIEIYLSSLSRDTTAEEEIERVERRLAETGARACKVKIGGRMRDDADAFPGRTDRHLALAAQRLTGHTQVYFDANSSYSVPRAIEVGRAIEAAGGSLFEEPVPWLDFEGTKRVADALQIDVAACEQEYDPWKFRWFLEHAGVDVIQPDAYYLGGLFRTMRVAREAHSRGVPILPHSPHADAVAAPMLIVAAVAAGAGTHHEFRIDPPTEEAWCVPRLTVSNGCVAVPTGPGLGFDFEPGVLAGAELVLRADA